MRERRWFYRRQVAAPLELWIMYSSSIPRKWEIEFALTKQPQPRLPQPCCPCTPLKIRNEKGSAPMLCYKTNKDSRLMYLRCIFPLSLHHRYKDKVTHVHTQTFTPAFCPSDAFYSSSITAVWARLMDDVTRCCSAHWSFSKDYVHLFFCCCPFC